MATPKDVPDGTPRVPTITVRVRKDSMQKDIVVYEHAVCARSEFFRRAVKGNWGTTEDRIITLDDTEPEIFDMYLEHLNTSRLPLLCDTDRRPKIKPTKWLIQADFERHSMVYILGERIMDVEVKNAVIGDMLVLNSLEDADKYTYTPTEETTALVYRETPPNSPIRRLFVDIWASLGDNGEDIAYDKVPKEFLQDLVTVLRTAEAEEDTPQVEKYLE